MGSNPILSLNSIFLEYSQVGKAFVFGTNIQRFESFYSKKQIDFELYFVNIRIVMIKMGKILFFFSFLFYSYKKGMFKTSSIDAEEFIKEKDLLKIKILELADFIGNTISFYFSVTKKCKLKFLGVKNSDFQNKRL